MSDTKEYIPRKKGKAMWNKGDRKQNETQICRDQFSLFLLFLFSDRSKKYNKPSTHELLLNKNVLRKEMSYIVEVFFRNCQKRMNYLKHKHLRELQQLTKLKEEADYKPVQKGSFTKHNLWNVHCNPKGTVFSTSLFKRHGNRNGQSNGFALKRFKNPKEKETIV